MRTCIMTIGTRGDVQPFVALGLGLSAAGHEVTIATLAEFKPLVESYGLQHDTLRGDFLKAAQTTSDDGATKKLVNPLRRMRQYVEMARDTLADEWSSAQGAELLIYSPTAMGGYHIAEKLGVPAFAAFPTPLYSPTKAFPSPFLPFSNLGPFNKLSHRLFARLGPAVYRRPIGEWRREVLDLPPAKGETMLRGKPVTKLYAYSELVSPRPADWDASSQITGYWFLDSSPDWIPPAELVDFLRSGPPPVYIGFGSMFMNGGVSKGEMAIKALKVAGQRGILATGWGGLAVGEASDDVFVVDDVPHDWLFPQVAAVVHHGGAGTTAAALRAGKPALVCPFVTDQFFWGRRVKALNAGPSPIAQWRLTAERLADGIRSAVEDEGMRERAAAVGEAIRAEDGVGRAVAVIHERLAG